MFSLDSARAWVLRKLFKFSCSIIILPTLSGFILCVGSQASAGYLDLSWNAPTTRVDGTPLDPATELTGYRVYFGDASTNQTAPPCNADALFIGNTTDYHLAGLTDEKMYFVQVTAIDMNGAESSCSNEASGIAHPGENAASIAASSGGGGGGGGCFIATAAYGSSLAPRVQRLREFRERYLRPHSFGRRFITLYERWSPAIANRIAQSGLLRTGVRMLLWPITWWASLALSSPRTAFIGLPFGACLVLFVILTLLHKRNTKGNSPASTS